MGSSAGTGSAPLGTTIVRLITPSIFLIACLLHFACLDATFLCCGHPFSVRSVASAVTAPRLSVTSNATHRARAFTARWHMVSIVDHDAAGVLAVAA